MFNLPKGKENQIAVLSHLRDAADLAANPYKVRWMVNHYWMNGCRDITGNFETGEVTATFRNPRDEDGRLRLLFEDLVVKLQAEVGRLTRMDIRPTCKRKQYGLDGVRQAATGRVTLDYLTGTTNWDVLKESVCYQAAMFGTCGVGAWIQAKQAVGVGEEISGAAKESKIALEIIPPWELYPIPHNPTVREEVQGILRKRWVPAEWAKSRTGLSWTSDTSKLNIQKAPYGVRPGLASPLGIDTISPEVSLMSQSYRAKVGTRADTEYVQMEEYFFMHDAQDRLARWMVKIGDHLALDQEYPDGSVYMPIGICRYHPIGGFYGRSFIEILIPLNRETEEMIQSLAQNVKDLDLFGTLLIPQTWGVSREELLERRKNRRVAFYEPDISAPEFDLKQVQPVNLNDFSGKVLAMTNQLVDRLTNQSDLLRGEAPGRVDSASGLSFLHSMSAVPLGVPANGIALGFEQVFRAILAAAPELLADRRTLPLSGFDDNLVGLQIDPETGAARIDPAYLPAPSEVELGIRDKLPTPEEVQIRKLQEALQMQLITPTEFRFTVWRENLDYPVANWAEQESYRKAVLQCLFLFNDGVEPRPQITSAEGDNPDVHLMVIQMFMSKAEFQFASREVRLAFEELKGLYLKMIGRRYPEQLPRPEELAAAMAAQAGGGGGPPGAIVR